MNHLTTTSAIDFSSSRQTQAQSFYHSLLFRPCDKLPFFKQCCLSLKTKFPRAGKVTQQLRTHIALPEDPSSVPNIHIGVTRLPSTLAPGNPAPSSVHHRHLHSLAHIHTDTHKHNQSFPAHTKTIQSDLSFQNEMVYPHPSDKRWCLGPKISPKPIEFGYPGNRTQS